MADQEKGNGVACPSQMEEFLRLCSASGDAAYGALKGLLQRLEDPSRRTEARTFLAALQRRLVGKDAEDECFRSFHFRIHDILLDNFEGHETVKKLTLIEIPSIFVPEDWSFTFYEGLNRHPDSIFRDKIVTELGCGNGWISIAIAKKWSPSKVYGLDINPRAIKIAWINLFLNAFDENGDPIYSGNGKLLLDIVEFHESDLLAYCRDNKIQLDRIVGCIPQILNPNPEAMSRIITEGSSEEFLYSLSNYCALQGFVEDQFGLGLIARAVEEGIDVIKPLGIMVFNMGGRPGQAVCRRLFERRGFQITRLWQTKVMQAADTDISALVEIENNSRHRFEFFMGLVSDQPICARTAWAYLKSGGRISHALSVYSCQLRQPSQVKKIFDFLKCGNHELSSSLDLSLGDDSVADEKIPFLAHLASFLKEHSYIPYEPPTGCISFRSLVAGFMKKYHHIPLTSDNVVVFPSRSTAIENTLRLFSPRLAIVDEHLTRQLPTPWLTSLTLEVTGDRQPAEDSITIIEAPHQSDLLTELIRKLKPQVVISSMATFEAVTSSAFENLLNTTKDVGSRVFLDISDHLELSSLPSSNGVLEYLSRNTLPSHAAVLCGLVKNRVYADLELAFIISEDASVHEALSKTVELLEGRTPFFSQQYYGVLFYELLAFQIVDRSSFPERYCDGSKSAKMIDLSNSVTTTFNEADLFPCNIDLTHAVHMDLDFSFLPTCWTVKASIFESFGRQNLTESEMDVRPGIQQFVMDNYGFRSESSSEIIYGNSSFALLNKFVLCCIQEKGTLLFPSGTNGHYVSAAKLLKANIVTIPTTANTGFKIVPATLSNLLGTITKPWLYISGPTINPTGLLYSNDEIGEILSVCAKFGVRVIIDLSFSGLEFESDAWQRWDLQQCLSQLTSPEPSFCVSLLGELSLGLLARGVDFGFLILSDPSLISASSSFPCLSHVHGTTRYAIKKLLALWIRKDQQFSEYIAEHKKILRTRANDLTKTLESCGWDVIGSSSGVSLVAKPTSYLGKTLKLEGFEARLDGTNFRDSVLRATGLCINSSSWTGIPDYYRLSYALEESDFRRALEGINLFNKLVLQS